MRSSGPESRRAIATASAVSQNIEIAPPCTAPNGLIAQSGAVISTTASSSPVETMARPSARQKSGKLIRSELLLARETSLVDRAAFAPLEHDLQETDARMDEQRAAGHVGHLEHLTARHAGLHETRGHVDHEAQPGEATPPLEPAADVARQRHALARDAVDGLAGSEGVRHVEAPHVGEGPIVD